MCRLTHVGLSSVGVIKGEIKKIIQELLEYVNYLCGRSNVSILDQRTQVLSTGNVCEEAHLAAWRMWEWGDSDWKKGK